MSHRAISVRSSLFWTLVLLLVLVSGSLLAVTIWQRARALEKLSGDMIDRAKDVTERELLQFIRPVTTLLHVSADWFRDGVVDPDDPDEMAAAYVPLIRLSPHLSSVNTGDAAGNGFMLLEERGAWLVRESRRGSRGGRARFRRLSEPDMRPLSEWRQALEYDPRQRPWYAGALAAATLAEMHEWSAAGRDPRIFWTAPYTFFTTRNPGITASRQMQNAAGRPFVLAVDVELSDISSFTQTLFPTPNGLVFVMDERGRLIGLPRESDLLDVRLGRGDMLRPLADVQTPALKAPFAAWRGRRVGDDRAPRNFAFQDHGRTMWGGWRAFPLSPETGLWIGVVVPESDLLGELERQKRTIIAITLVTLVLAALASVWLARFYSLPLRRLVGESERIRRLDLQGRGRVVSRLREVHQLAEAQESMRAALASFARYLPTDVVRELLARGEAAQIGGRVETLTVMFTDIVGFTRIAEGLSAPALAHHLSDYFECLLEALQRHQATIDKLVGDGVMAFWGAPRPDPRHARHAVEGALGCLEALSDFNRRCPERGMPDLPTRVALAAGEAVVGNIGAMSRLNYTALGDTVNLASRLVKVNDLYGTAVLVARPVREAAGDAFAWRLLDRIMVRGKREAVEIFEPLGPAGQVDRGRLLLAEQYEAALRAFWRRDFDRAVRGLEEIGATGGKDRSVVRLLALARGYLTHPPPENWDGTARREDE